MRRETPTPLSTPRSYEDSRRRSSESVFAGLPRDLKVMSNAPPEAQTWEGNLGAAHDLSLGMRAKPLRGSSLLLSRTVHH